MKTIGTILITLILPLALIGAENTKEVKPEIKSVTMFPDRAQVSLEMQTTLQAGVTTLVVPSLSRFLIPASLQVKGSGAFMIMNVNHRLNYLTENGDPVAVVEIKKEIESLRLKVEEDKSGLEALKEKEAFLIANRDIGGKTNVITTEQLKSLMDLWSSSMETNKASILKKTRTIRETETRISLLEKQIQQMRTSEPQAVSELLITISADKAVTGKLSVSFIVTNAGWYPSYDIRVDDTNGPVMINYKANLFQNTGQDWNNVKLSFSNANPGLPGTLPVLYPWIINFPPPPQSIQIRGVSSKSARPSAMKQEYAEMAMLDEVAEESYAVPVTMSETATGFTFDLNISQTVLSNGQENQVELQRLTADAGYKYKAVPKMRPSAFLTANISDWESLSLLPGEANIYFANTFTGTTYINPSQLTDTMSVSLGTDPGIVIKREKRKEYSATKLIGSNRLETRSWTISVRNSKKTDVSLTLTDQIPLSGNSEITVEALELSGGKHDPLKGEVTWNLELKAGETKDIILTYSVKYPKNRNLVIE